MINLIKKLYSFFDKRQCFQLKLIFCAVFLMGIMEVVGVLSIMPFMAVVAKPAVIFENQYLNMVYDYFGFTSTNRFLFFLGLIVLVALTLNNAFSALINWGMLRFANLRNYTLSERLLAGYLHQPYLFFLSKNTAELTKNLFTEVQRVITGILMPLLQIVAKLVSAFFILALLIAVNPLLALIVVAVLGSAYVSVYLLVRGRLARLGVGISEYAGKRNRSAFEALGGIKDLKLLGKEAEFLQRYAIPARRYALSNASSQSLTQLPRYALEIIAFGGILVIVLYFLSTKSDISEVLPLIALYAFAGYRLMPSLQQLYVAFSTVRNNTPALDILYEDMEKYGQQFAAHGPGNDGHNIAGAQSEAINFAEVISLKNIVFQYPNTSEAVIRGIDLKIQADTTIGIVGGTGSGKTTLVDIILGLLEPASGSISIDNKEVTPNNMRQWQASLGYVPQTIYLTDDTVAANIAFGLSADKIDSAAVKKAAKIANIDGFISNELPEGYETRVGERGVRLSGGQRQRIGIARALYRDPSVLILDEATSALDGVTEGAIIEAMDALAHKKTIIMIAHRLTTLMGCDVIYMMEDGRIIESGSYKELMATSQRFQDMAKLGGEN